MRVDKFLKVSRLIKRRTVANDVADAGRIEVNGKVVKASYNVKVNDLLTLNFGNKPITVKVLSVDNIQGKDIAREMYTIIEE
jgi:Ribosome-associated heat shock protein implicated in the recycling of the 50S subunit (S4 paralog)